MRSALFIGIIAAGGVLWFVSQPGEAVSPESGEEVVSTEVASERTTTFSSATATTTTTSTRSAATAVQLAGSEFSVEIADTPAERAHGLSGRPALPEDELLLFVFERSATHAFWMKDMRFAIDIMWLNEKGEVIYVKQNVSPDTFPESFAPDARARYVLEAAAGFAARHGVEIGTQFTLPEAYR